MESMERHGRHFQEELEQLKARLLEMGGIAEEQVRVAVTALVNRDREAIERVLSGDEPINKLHIEIDGRCFTLLALHQPMAVDLRAIVSAVKINTDLERVGDLAINIAEASRGWRPSRRACCATRSTRSSGATWCSPSTSSTRTTSSTP